MSKENNENYELELSKKKELLVVEDIELLKGRTIKAVVTDHEDFVIFVISDNEVVMMNHARTCCENVSIENINGDLNHLLDTPLLRAEVKYTGNMEADYGDAQYTFYTLATKNGYVDLRWCGESNGYYSIDVEMDNISVYTLQKFLQNEFSNRRNFKDKVKIYTNQNNPAIKFETKMLGASLNTFRLSIDLYKDYNGNFGIIEYQTELFQHEIPNIMELNTKALVYTIENLKAQF